MPALAFGQDRMLADTIAQSNYSARDVSARDVLCFIFHCCERDARGSREGNAKITKIYTFYKGKTRDNFKEGKQKFTINISFDSFESKNKLAPSKKQTKHPWSTRITSQRSLCSSIKTFLREAYPGESRLPLGGLDRVDIWDIWAKDLKNKVFTMNFTGKELSCNYGSFLNSFTKILYEADIMMLTVRDRKMFGNLARQNRIQLSLR